MLAKYYQAKKLREYSTPVHVVYYERLLESLVLINNLRFDAQVMPEIGILVFYAKWLRGSQKYALSRSIAYDSIKRLRRKKITERIKFEIEDMARLIKEFK